MAPPCPPTTSFSVIAHSSICRRALNEWMPAPLFVARLLLINVLLIFNSEELSQYIPPPRFAVLFVMFDCENISEFSLIKIPPPKFTAVLSSMVTSNKSKFELAAQKIPPPVEAELLDIVTLSRIGEQLSKQQIPPP